MRVGNADWARTAPPPRAPRYVAPMTDPHTRGMAAIGAGVSVAAAVAPRTFMRVFGVGDDATGGAVLGWRLFAARTALLSGLALRGDATARDAFLPIQIMDQAAWWWGYGRGHVPLRTAAMASVASGAIVAFDLRRRMVA